MYVSRNTFLISSQVGVFARIVTPHASEPHNNDYHYVGRYAAMLCLLPEAPGRKSGPTGNMPEEVAGGCDDDVIGT